MMEKQMIDKLYEENLKLGNRINILTDENNFYRIQINNFNKLTYSINKDLYKLGLNFQKNQKIGDNVKVGPLFVISNKIKLKNLQMKVGNSIRQTQKFKKNLEGSLPVLMKKVQDLQQEIVQLVAKHSQIWLQNQLLENIERQSQIINKAHHQLSLYLQQTEQQNLDEEFKEGQLRLAKLSDEDNDSIKKLQHIKKQQKEKNKILQELKAQNEGLQNQVQKLKRNLPRSYQTNYLRARQAKQLQNLYQEEDKLLNDIRIEKRQLQIQHTSNLECKQRIADKKEQENKQIKVLEDQVQKCREQVKEVKIKFKELMGKKNKHF